MSLRVAVGTSSFARHDSAPLDLLRRAGLEVALNPHGRVLTEAEALELYRGCAGILAGTEPLGAGLLARLPGLRVISRVGVGLDNVDLAQAERLGIAVRNTPQGPTRAVAELTVGLVLDLLRQVSLQDRELRAGVWKKRMGRLLAGRRVGLVGFGSIGRATAALFAALGAQVAYHDPAAPDPGPPDGGPRPMAFRELLGWAEVLSLHCSKPSAPGHLLGAAELDLMPHGAWLVNAARGGLVDEEALAERLASGRLSGAAVDVFNREPYAGPLASLPCTVLTPHIGSYAQEGRVQMEVDAARNLLAALDLAADT